MEIALFSILFYLVSSLLVLSLMSETHKRGRQKRVAFFLCALLAISLHAFSTFPLLTNLANQGNFSLIGVASLMAMCVAFIATLAMLYIDSAWVLLPIIYAFSIVNLIFATFLPRHLIHLLNQNTSMLFHIGLSIFTYAICFIATLYAIQIAWIDKKLKNRKLNFSPMLPPLMTAERHFFCLFAASELLLSITLISGSWHLMNAWTADNLHKAIFSLFAWVIFGVACIGHWRANWRGKKMMLYAVLGTILLTFGYFGSRLI